LSRLNAANNAQTLLVGAITDTDTVMTVLDGSIFPEPPFLVTVEDEIIEVRAKTGNVFGSLLRGQEGTVAVAHADGVEVQNRMTVGMYDSLALQEDVTDLAGTGRTIETVKGNADDLAAHLADTAQHIDGNGACRVYLGANQSIPNATFTEISFANESYDNATIHDNSTNPTRLTAPVAGKYLVFGNISFAPNTTGNRTLIIRENGPTGYIRAYRSQVAVNGGSTTMGIMDVLNLAQNDYVELLARQDSGGALNVESGYNLTFFGMIKVG